MFPSGRVDRSQQGRALVPLFAAVRRSEYRLDRRLALLGRPVLVRRPPWLQRAQVEPVFEESLGELVVAGGWSSARSSRRRTIGALAFPSECR